MNKKVDLKKLRKIMGINNVLPENITIDYFMSF